jgi:hypothetical protein
LDLHLLQRAFQAERIDTTAEQYAAGKCACEFVLRSDGAQTPSYRRRRGRRPGPSPCQCKSHRIGGTRDP